MEELTIAVRVVEPYSTPTPVSLNGDFTWAMVSKQEKDSDYRYTSPIQTRLELYWIAPDIHEIFFTGLSGISVNTLRCLFSHKMGMLHHSVDYF